MTRNCMINIFRKSIKDNDIKQAILIGMTIKTEGPKGTFSYYPLLSRALAFKHNCYPNLKGYIYFDKKPSIYLKLNYLLEPT